MFRKGNKPILDSMIDTMLDWTWKGSNITADGWDDWLNYRPPKDNVVDKKEKEVFLVVDNHLAKIRLEALVGSVSCKLKVTVLELDGRPILAEEQKEKEVEIVQADISENDQRRLVAMVMNNFGIRAGEKIGVVTDDFARSYARFLRIQNSINQKA